MNWLYRANMRVTAGGGLAGFSPPGPRHGAMPKAAQPILNLHNNHRFY